MTSIPRRSHLQEPRLKEASAFFDMPALTIPLSPTHSHTYTDTFSNFSEVISGSAFCRPFSFTGASITSSRQTPSSSRVASRHVRCHASGTLVDHRAQSRPSSRAHAQSPSLALVPLLDCRSLHLTQHPRYTPSYFLPSCLSADFFC